VSAWNGRALLAALLLAGAGGCSRPPVARTAADGRRLVDIDITAEGFSPSRVEVKAGEPLLLRFTRKVDPTCADAVVIEGDPVKHLLPQGHTIEVPLAGPKSGALHFACPMDMYKGTIVVSD
jgi:plastocyanin domain-containing protein